VDDCPRRQPDGDVRPLVDAARNHPAAAARRQLAVRSRADHTVAVVRCPTCSSLDDKVIDSRTADDGSAIRRRRECLACGSRFTTFERLEEAPLVVIKRSGERSPFERSKVVDGVLAAAKGRPVSIDQLEALAGEVEGLRSRRRRWASERIGLAVLDRLRVLDEVTHALASLQGADEADDFARELTLLRKSTEPKRSYRISRAGCPSTARTASRPLRGRARATCP
jgi:transcriptional repressor NrdR